MEHKGKETKLYKLNKEIKKLQEDQRFEQEEERKKLQNEQNQLEVEKKKHAEEEMRFLRHKEQHARMMEKEIEEMKKEKEAQKIRQKKFYDEVKKFAAKERKFGVWKEHKSKKELDLEEREKNLLLKENANKTLSRQLTIQMTIHEEKERINERKVLDKEAEFKIKREESFVEGKCQQNFKQTTYYSNDYQWRKRKNQWKKSVG